MINDHCGNEIPDTPLELKKKKKFPIWLPIAIVAVLIIASVAGVVVYSNSPAQRLKKQLSLGERYLSELKYEDAVAAFTAALEIDPKDPEAQESYVTANLAWADDLAGKDDYAMALAVLQEAINRLPDERLSAKMEEIRRKQLGVIVREYHYTEPERSLIQWSEYRYDKAGNMVQQIMYHADNSYYWRLETSYDDAGRRSVENYYEGSDPAVVTRRYEYSYDDHGNQNACVFTFDTGATGTLWYDNSYDDQGNMIHTDLRDGQYHDYSYDENGNMTESLYFNGQGDTERYVSQYDAENRKIREDRYYKDELTGYQTYEYDEKGRLIAQQIMDTFEYGKVGTRYQTQEQYVRVEYEYDSVNNAQLDDSL